MADPDCRFVIERLDPHSGPLPPTYVCSRWSLGGQPGACLACDYRTCSVYLAEPKTSDTAPARND